MTGTAPSAARRTLPLVAATCGVLGIAGWAFYLVSFAREPSQDWMVYYSAARAYWNGTLPLLFDGTRFTAALNARFAAWLSWPLPLHPWLYPPHFLLLLLPFGLLPFAPAQAAFLALSFAALLLALRSLEPGVGRHSLPTLSLLLCPATAITVCLGQNAFLTSALLIGGIGNFRRRPVLAGALLGLLTIKPQLWLMVPVALLAARAWRTLASTLATAAGVALVSLIVFGGEVWHAWFDLMLRPSAEYQAWLLAGRLNGQSVYACAALLGATPLLANLIQGLATLIAAGCVFWCFRRPAGADLRLAILLAATFLGAPHVIGYDGVMLAMAATLLLRQAAVEGFRPGEAILIVAVWACPLINPPSVFRIGLVTPLLIALFLACAAARIRNRDAVAAGRLSPAQ